MCGGLARFHFIYNMHEHIQAHHTNLCICTEDILALNTDTAKEFFSLYSNLLSTATEPMSNTTAPPLNEGTTTTGADISTLNLINGGGLECLVVLTSFTRPDSLICAVMYVKALNRLHVRGYGYRI